jgi:sodium transport system permease protein
MKEALDLLRDRRTIITALLLPLISFPILFGVLGYFSNPTSNPSPVLLANMDDGSVGTNIQNTLLRTSGISITLAQPGVNLTQAVQQSRYDVAVLIPPGFSSAIEGGGQANITLYFNPSNSRAQTGISIVQSAVGSISQQIASLRLQQKGVTQSDLNPIMITQATIGKTTNPTLVLAASIFPSFLLYFTFLGGFYFMVDGIAGEKERRSLEAHNTQPHPRNDIFLGK